MDNTKEDKDLEKFNKVMSLTDLEICMHLARIEGLNTYIQSSSVRIVVADGDDYYFNPLDDSDQLIELMVKHNVQRFYEPYDFIGWCYHVLRGENPIHITERQDLDNPNAPDISMQKAVCLAIILNKSKML